MSFIRMACGNCWVGLIDRPDGKRGGMTCPVCDGNCVVMRRFDEEATDSGGSPDNTGNNTPVSKGYGRQD